GRGLELNAVWGAFTVWLDGGAPHMLVVCRCHGVVLRRCSGRATASGLGAARAAARRARCRRSCQARPTAAATAAVWVAVRIHQVIATPPLAGCRGCGGSRQRSCLGRAGRASAGRTGRRAGRRPRRRDRRTTAGRSCGPPPDGYARSVGDAGGVGGAAGAVLDERKAEVRAELDHRRVATESGGPVEDAAGPPVRRMLLLNDCG